MCGCERPGGRGSSAVGAAQQGSCQSSDGRPTSTSTVTADARPLGGRRRPPQVHILLTNVFTYLLNKTSLYVFYLECLNNFSTFIRMQNRHNYLR